MGNSALKNISIWLVALIGSLHVVESYGYAAEGAAEKRVGRDVAPGTATATPFLPSAVREEVVGRLNQIRPKDAKDLVYKVAVADTIERLPGNLCLDLFYKIGHHQWSLVALRFERREGQPEVNITEVVYGSAFGFIKQFMRSSGELSADRNGPAQETDSRAKYFDHRDFCRVRRGAIPVGTFDHLLVRGLGLWRSSISEVYVGPPRATIRSSMMSSGDGLILLCLSEDRPNGRTVLKDHGSLISGDLAPRIQGGPDNYRYVRTHLFWEGFHEYVSKHPLAVDLPPKEAVPLLVARLKEPPLAEDYQDYFRRSLYVEVLGELGRAEAIPALREAARDPGLDGSWDGFLRRDIAEAIAKIDVLSANDATEEMIRVLTTSGHRLASWAVERIERLPQAQRTAALLRVGERPGLKANTLCWVLRGLAGVKQDEVRRCISRHLHDADAKTRLLAATLLWRTWRDPDAPKTLYQVFLGKGLETAQYPEDLQVSALRVLLEPADPAGDVKELLPTLRAELEKPEDYWVQHPYVINCTLEMAILWNLRVLLPAAERMARFKSGNARANAIDALIRLAPEKARKIVSTMNVSDTRTLQMRRPFYAALLKVDELVQPLEDERRIAEKEQPKEESEPVVKRIDLALRAVRAATAREHALAVLALVHEHYRYDVTGYLAISHLREIYPDNPQVQAVTGEFLDRPVHARLRTWFQAAERRTRSTTHNKSP